MRIIIALVCLLAACSDPAPTPPEQDVLDAARVQWCAEHPGESGCE
jgi:hypothetical protein